MVKKLKSSVQLHGFAKPLRMELSEYIQSYILPNRFFKVSLNGDIPQKESLHLIWFSEHLTSELKKTVIELRKSGFPIYIIVIGNFEKMEHVITALQLGINGCVSYKLNHPELLNAVETILLGKDYLCPVTLKTLFKPYKKPSGENLKDYQLTIQEQTIMPELCKGKKYKEIGKQLYISENTVRSHIRHLYKKLGVHSITEMISKFIINNEESKKIM